MPKARVSLARVVVASPTPRDGVAPAPSAELSPSRSGRSAERVRRGDLAPTSSGSSNVRSSPRSRVPLGARDPAVFSPTSGALASAPSSKSSRARFVSPPFRPAPADLSAAATAPAFAAPLFASPAISAATYFVIGPCGIVAFADCRRTPR
jgi:hypothetical protein